ncbi:MAG: putative manganese-dependent inorganic diphosphatase [Erysipelotrichia bacterium]|nr:putative manganese-dependent inorganic diphosphatase [Erysipelotrichia bacterium]
MNNTIYVTGHRHPDTDSICAAVSYANLLRLLGSDAVALRQGPLNEETKFVLKKFHQENPLLLTDARFTLSDIDLDVPALIEHTATVHHAWHVMLHTQNRSLFVVDDDNKLCGICTTSNLSMVRLKRDADLQELMASASLSDIAHTTGGRIAVEPAHFHINGTVHVITLEGTEASLFALQDSIAILAGSKEKQRMLIEAGVSCLVITCGQSVSDEIRLLALHHNAAVIVTESDTMHTASVITESYPIDKVMTKDLITFQDSEYVEDVAQKMTKSRVRSYPVLNEEGDVVGAVSRYHTRSYQRRKIVLVDHSAVNQSIGNLENADIIGVIDHHHVGDIETTHPINYRGVQCGCTCTIVTDLYTENGLLPDADMSGLMLSAILSDTLDFRSATATSKDRLAVSWLAKRAGIENIDDYAAEMLNSSVALKDSTPHEILNRDLKIYEISGKRVAIGQTNYSQMADVQFILPEFRIDLEKEQQEKKYDLMVMLFTHVLGEGSLFVYYGSLSNVIGDLIETRFDDHSGFDPAIISRKQQLMPKLSQIIRDL